MPDCNFKRVQLKIDTIHRNQTALRHYNFKPGALVHKLDETTSFQEFLVFEGDSKWHQNAFVLWCNDFRVLRWIVLSTTREFSLKCSVSARRARFKGAAIFEEERKVGSMMNTLLLYQQSSQTVSPKHQECRNFLNKTEARKTNRIL